MFKKKITLKLSLITIGLFMLLVGIVIGTQFFIVSRMYLTTEYTKQREKTLSENMRFLLEEYYPTIYEDDREKIKEVLNDYTYKNTAYCFILDKDMNIIYESDNTVKLKKIYINNIKKNIQEITDYPDSNSFRINSYLNIPSKYIGIWTSIDNYQYTYNKHDSNTKYFVAVTEEVYTSDNYLVLRKYSIYLFIIAGIFVIILAIIFSFIITKPILKLRDAAIRMTNLDFTNKCDYKSDDEIGELSTSLNFLAEKLDNALNDLKEANLKLQDDLSIQREIDKMRKDFIAAVSHEFKTPLTLIRGFNEVIADNRITGEEIKEAQNIIINEVDRMDNLVKELLDLSKLESEVYVLKKERFDCVKLINDIIEKYKIIIEEKNINLQYDFDGVSVWIYADKSRIEQVLMNFISNAIINTYENGTIILKTETVENHIEISVFNKGRHINKDDIDKVWDKFYRGDKSRSIKTGGTGLGLSICKEILEKHKCIYGVENVEDGVKFYFIMKKNIEQ